MKGYVLVLEAMIGPSAFSKALLFVGVTQTQRSHGTLIIQRHTADKYIRALPLPSILAGLIFFVVATCAGQRYLLSAEHCRN
jgi:hypothetical protein